MTSELQKPSLLTLNLSPSPEGDRRSIALSLMIFGKLFFGDLKKYASYKSPSIM